MSETPARARLLFVHAHPDDETLATGLALAAHARAGHEVHLLTCTLGEEGEIIPPELAHLAADGDDALGPYRRGELRRAMAVLGVREQVLGETGACRSFRDSGMAGVAANTDPRSFVAGDVDQEADLVREHVRSIAPDLVVTYDATGGYGHPDHVRVHDVVRAALAGIEPAGRAALLVRLTPRDWAQEDRAWLADHVPADSPARLPEPTDPYPPSVVDGERVGLEIAAGPQVRALRDAALREHRTQVSVYDGYYALSNGIAARLTSREGYAQVDPADGTTRPAGAVALFRPREWDS